MCNAIQFKYYTTDRGVKILRSRTRPTSFLGTNWYKQIDYENMIKNQQISIQ